MTFKNTLEKEVVVYSRKNHVHSRVIFPASHYYLHSCIGLFVLYFLLFDNYWTRLSKILRFVSGEQINYLPRLKAEANS